MIFLKNLKIIASININFNKIKLIYLLYIKLLKKMQ